MQVNQKTKVKKFFSTIIFLGQIHKEINIMIAMACVSPATIHAMGVVIQGVQIQNFVEGKDVLSLEAGMMSTIENVEIIAMKNHNSAHVKNLQIVHVLKRQHLVERGNLADALIIE